MLRAKCLAMLIFFALATAARPAAAQGANHDGGHAGDEIRCASGKLESAIIACTNIIDDKREDDDIRASALQNRGFYYQQRGDLDRALAVDAPLVDESLTSNLVSRQGFTDTFSNAFHKSTTPTAGTTPAAVIKET